MATLSNNNYIKLEGYERMVLTHDCLIVTITEPYNLIVTIHRTMTVTTLQEGTSTKISVQQLSVQPQTNVIFATHHGGQNNNFKTSDIILFISTFKKTSPCLTSLNMPTVNYGMHIPVGSSAVPR